MRKGLKFLVVLMVCLPLGGQGQIALGRYVPHLETPSFTAPWWLGPREIAIAAACLFVLALTASMHWTDPKES